MSALSAAKTAGAADMMSASAARAAIRDALRNMFILILEGLTDTERDVRAERTLRVIEAECAQAELRDVEPHADADVGMPREHVEVGRGAIAVELLAADDAHRTVVAEEY